MDFVLKLFVEVVPCEETWFSHIELPKYIRLSKEQILLNYSHLNPYGEKGDIIYFQSKEHLYLWFYKKKEKKPKILIPECYLYVKNLMNKNFTGIAYAENSDHFILFVLKNGLLLSQIRAKKEQFDHFLDLLTREYSLKKTELQKVKYTSPTIRDIIKFSLTNKSLEPKEELTIYLLEVLLIALFIYLIVIIGEFMLLKRETSKIEDEIAKASNNYNEVISKYFTLENAANFWRNFISNELQYPKFSNVLLEISHALQGECQIRTIQFLGNRVTLEVESFGKNPLNLLSKVSCVENTKIISTSTRGKKTIYTIELYLKEESREKTAISSRSNLGLSKRSKLHEQSQGRRKNKAVNP